MNTVEFIIRRTFRAFGLANERNHLRVASEQSQYLNEAEDMLGRIAWKDVADVPELAEEHWKIKEIEKTQQGLEDEIAEIEAANKALTQKRDDLELKSEERLAEITNKKTETMRSAIAQMHEVESSRAAAEMTKKKYTGLRLKMKILSEEEAPADEIAEVEAGMQELKLQYAQDKETMTRIAAEISDTEAEIANIEAEIETLREEARKSMASMMNKVSKSSKLVAEYTARIGSMEATKRALCFKIGGFLSANFPSDDPDLKPLVKKYRNILSKISDLRISIHRHRLLAGRDEPVA